LSVADDVSLASASSDLKVCEGCGFPGSRFFNEKINWHIVFRAILLKRIRFKRVLGWQKVAHFG
jgi:hypothetical protein